MALPTKQQVFSEARERLNRVYEELGNIRDLLASDVSDGPYSDTESELGILMVEQTLAAKQAVENAKSGRIL